MFILRIMNPTFEQTGMTSINFQHSAEWTLYKYSSFLYPIAGLIRIHQNAYIDGLNLVVQGYLSYMSDVKTLGLRSKWHLSDRYIAIYVCLYHFYSLRTFKKRIVNFLIFLVGLHFLKKSQTKYLANDKNFLSEHTKWHACSIFLALSSYAF